MEILNCVPNHNPVCTLKNTGRPGNDATSSAQTDIVYKNTGNRHAQVDLTDPNQEAISYVAISDNMQPTWGYTLPQACLASSCSTSLTEGDSALLTTVAAVKIIVTNFRPEQSLTAEG